jgi:hypothetical protein
MQEMTNDPLPVSSSHRTFTFGAVVIDSNFDSGNCSHAEKVSDSKVRIALFSLIFGLELIIQRTNIEHGFIFLSVELKREKH